MLEASQARQQAAWLLALAVLGLAGCVHLPVCDHACVVEQVQERLGQPLAAGPEAGPEPFVPPRFLTQDQAVAYALWNNPGFQELLTELKITQADLVQAGLLPNPEFVYYPPAYDKVYKYLADFPIESLWLRPLRLAAAQRENDRVCQRLVQGGLDLIRDVRQAYSDVLLARDRLAVAQEGVRVRGQIARLAAARLRAGDIGPQEEATARIDALQARQDEARARAEVPVVAARLRNLLGLDAHCEELVLDGTVPIPSTPLCIDPLLGEAVNSRPDVMAASRAVEAAYERRRLAKVSWVRLLGIFDATSGLKRDHEPGVGFRFTVPVFNQGQGGIARADAELDRAQAQLNTAQHTALFDVRRSFAQYQQARAELDILEGKVLPEVERAISRAERAYREGNASYVIVLESSRQLLDTRLRRAVLRGDLRRAWAELERSVGHKLPLADAGPHPAAAQPAAAPPSKPRMPTLPPPREVNRP
jgi:cobalt-zinc-cadmium efflux system outer membrane protein